MVPFTRMTLALAILALAGTAAEAQLGMFSKEQRESITSKWTGERFEDGDRIHRQVFVRHETGKFAEPFIGFDPVFFVNQWTCAIIAAGRAGIGGKRVEGQQAVGRTQRHQNMPFFSQIDQLRPGGGKVR